MLEVGDIICFDEYAYRSYKLGEQEYHLVDVATPDKNKGLWLIIRNNETLLPEGMALVEIIEDDRAIESLQGDPKRIGKVIKYAHSPKGKSL